MSNKYLGKDFDIHGGGADLKFPHHENEIAQSKCANKGSIFAKHWMHNGFLMIEGKKMSKSLGNFITINEMREQNINGNVLRMALLSTQYRKPMNFSQKLLQDTEKMYYKFSKAKDSIKRQDIENIKLTDKELEPLYQDLNITKLIANINKLYSEKQYTLVYKMLEFIGINF
jgi:cysteinyl-tRNA synthetase